LVRACVAPPPPFRSSHPRARAKYTRRFGPYLGATAAALVYNYLLAYQPEAHPIPPGSSSDAPGVPAPSAPPAVEAKEAALEAVAVTGGGAATTSDLNAWK